jgi:hypothetical protein
MNDSSESLRVFDSQFYIGVLPCLNPMRGLNPMRAADGKFLLIAANLNAIDFQ